MKNESSTKVIIMFIMALISSILTLLDFILIDPIPFLDEIGIGGITTVLWSYFVSTVKKSKKKNSKVLSNK